MIGRPAAASTQNAASASRPAATPSAHAPVAPPRQREQAAAGGGQQDRLAEDLAEPARDASRGRARCPVTRPSSCRVVARAGQRVQRVAGEQEVVQRPQQRAARGERDERGGVAPAVLRRGLRAGPPPQPRPQQPREVGGREQPRLGAQQAGQREQREHRAAASAAARLDEQRAEDEHEERDVDVGARAEVEHRARGSARSTAASTPAAVLNHSRPSAKTTQPSSASET